MRSSITSVSSSRSTATAATACSRRCCSAGATASSPASSAPRLSAALPEYDVVTELAAIPRELRGLHPSNPVNVPLGGGVQIGAATSCRADSGRVGRLDGDGFVPPAAALVDVLAGVAGSWDVP